MLGNRKLNDHVLNVCLFSKIVRYLKRGYQVLPDTTQKISIHIIENTKGILVKDDTEILNRWSEYFKDLYNYQKTPDRNLISNRKSYSEISLLIIKSEVEQAIRNIKTEKRRVLIIFQGNYSYIYIYIYI